MATQSLRILVLAFLSISFYSPLQAAAQVDCSNPDNLCTGDPCITVQMDVLSPCVADFGTRTLVIGGTLTVPDAGVLDLTAATIQVEGRIAGRNENGTQISLTASGDIEVEQLIEASGRQTPGTVTLDAGGNIALRARIVSRPRGAPAPGGDVTIDADGTLTSISGGVVSVKAGNTAAGGQIDLSGDLGVDLEGFIDARGGTGGMITITSTAGDVTIGEDLAVESKVGAAGNVSISAAGAVTTDEKIEANGRTDGGGIAIVGDTVEINAQVQARGITGIGNIVYVAGTNGITIDQKLDTDSGQLGGCVAVISMLGNVAVNRNIEARGSGFLGDGGRIYVSAGGDVTVDRDITTRSDEEGGSIELIGANLNLPGDFFAQGDLGGTIEATATGNITTAGSNFDARVGGCIALSAGGTLDLSGDFDPAPVASCPPPFTSCPF